MPVVGQQRTSRLRLESAAVCCESAAPLHQGRHALPVPVVFPCEREIGPQVLLDGLIEDGLLGMAAAVPDRSTFR